VTGAVPVRCPVCGEVSEISVDPSGGALQEYTEDCPVCCQPWQVELTRDSEGDWNAELRRDDE